MRFKVCTVFSLVCAAAMFGGPFDVRRHAQQAQGQERPAPSRAVAQFPFELNGNLIFFKGSVNDSAPLWLTLDTGAHSSVVNLRHVRALGLRSYGAQRATGAGGTVESVGLAGVSFRIDRVELKDLHVAALPLESIEETAGRAMDAIVGSELFRRYVVEIDYADRRITLYEPATYEHRGAGESFPLSFRHNHPYVRARVALPGGEAVEGEFVLDAGSNLPVILLKSFVERTGLASRVPPTLSTRARGVGGEVVMPVGRATHLQLGGYVLKAPVTAFPPAGFFADQEKAGNIGGAVLRRFKVIFDYSRSRMFLESNRHFDEPFEYDMSGLGLRTETPLFKKVKVSNVIENSPAAEAGVRVGDEVVTFEGRPAADFTLAELREILRQPARKFRLQVRRGDALVQVELTTRRLV